MKTIKEDVIKYLANFKYDYKSIWVFITYEHSTLLLKN